VIFRLVHEAGASLEQIQATGFLVDRCVDLSTIGRRWSLAEANNRKGECFQVLSFRCRSWARIVGWMCE